MGAVDGHRPLAPDGGNGGGHDHPVVGAAVHPAACQRPAQDAQAVAAFLHLGAQGAQHGGDGSQAVALFEPQPAGMADLRPPLGAGRHHREHRDQVGDGPGVDGDAAQRAGEYGGLAGRRLHPGAKAGQHIQHGPVALGGIQAQAGDRDRLAQGAGAQPECGVGPIAFGLYGARAAVALAGRHPPAVFQHFHRHAEPGHGGLGDADVIRRLHRGGQPDDRAAGQQGGGQQKAGDELGAHVAGQLEFPAGQPAPDGKGQAGGGKGDAVALQLLHQGAHGALGKPAVAGKAGPGAQSGGHGQQKPQGRTALTAIQQAGGGQRTRRDLPQAGPGRLDGSAQGLQAAHGVLHILGKAPQAHLGGAVGQSGADEQPVGVGFGGDGRQGARQRAGHDSLFHHSAPRPAPMKDRSSSTGMVWR